MHTDKTEHMNCFILWENNINEFPELTKGEIYTNHTYIMPKKRVKHVCKPTQTLSC